MSHSPYPQTLSPYIQLQRATATIDEITKVLSEFSRSTTPELLHDPTCACCDVENCETKLSWERDRVVLVDRLVLSAEIGQALLERHEAYVADQKSLYDAAQERISSLERSNDQAVSRMEEFVRSKDNAETCEAQARLNLDIAESSNRVLLQEVQEERAANSRLSAQLARSTALEERLNVLTLERDDLMQERDAESARSRALESKMAAVNVKCSSLQADVNRLSDQLEMQGRCSPQRELSEQILREARSRLEMMQHSLQAQPDNSELMHLLETLVVDSEALKRDNAELRNFLGEARTELRTLSDEVLELRAGATPLNPVPVDVVLKSSSPPLLSHMPTFNRRTLSNTTHNANYRRGEGWASTYAIAHSQPNSPPPYQLGFPNSRNNSPRMLLAALDDPATRNIRESTPGGIPSSANIAPQPEGGNDADDGLPTPIHPKQRRILLLLSQSRAVQTDPTEQDDHLSDLPPQMRPLGPSLSKGAAYSDAPSTTDQTSETSSISGMASVTAPLPELIERLNALLTRLNQTTVESLTARLKRQNLLGGSDISHLSRSTIVSIQNDVAQLRTHFRNTLDVERQLEMTRKDLRNLLRMAKDIFNEMGRLKAVVNDITLDPSNAARVLAAAQDDGTIIPPSGTTHPNDAVNKDRGVRWITPLTKLFGPSGALADSGDAGPSRSNALREANTALSASTRAPAKLRAPPRPVPKLAAAVSSSATTVNVEFSSSHARRAVSTTAAPSSDNEAAGASSSGAVARQVKKPRRDNLLDIFAGAPLKPDGDSWVILPRDMPKMLRGATSVTNLGGPPSRTDHRVRLSRNVDAIVDTVSRRHSMIDEEVEDALVDDADEDEGAGHSFQETILERARTLRPRGLSDSSIHSTFLAAAGEGDSGILVNRLVTPANLALASADTSTVIMGLRTSLGTFDRQKVLQNLKEKGQSFPGYRAPGAALSLSTTSARTSRGYTAGDAVTGTSTTNSKLSTALPTTPTSPHRPTQPPTPIPARSPSKRGNRHPSTNNELPSSSPGRIPVLSNLLAAVVDNSWSDNEQGVGYPHPPPHWTRDMYDRSPGRRDGL